MTATMTDVRAPNSASSSLRDRSDESARAIARGPLLDRYRAVRDFSLSLSAPLAAEDQVVQSMPDVSPTKWHLAHTTWFFERFVLEGHRRGYAPWKPEYGFLFNSYYQSIGPMHTRARRGQITRPTVAEVGDYRRAVDERLSDFVDACDDECFAEIAPLIELGCHHEQQHQELILTDIKYNLSCNPTLPEYHEAKPETRVRECPAEARWVEFGGGVRAIGHEGGSFCFDNELPRHDELVRPYALASRLVTNAEFAEFVDDGGYERAELWLDAGYAEVVAEARSHPLYWYRAGGDWMQYTLAGPLALDADEPVCHVSFFEADAFARWRGRRLPSEAEWELAAARQPLEGNLAERGRFHVEAAAGRDGALQQVFGDVWEWTASPYLGYPGYRPPPGAVGEYNGKFMCNQFVLRGGSCATPRSHLRASYRNFFPPEARWQFSGIRLAVDA
jgi:ergothioneine biosynthesis protein EgtB